MNLAGLLSASARSFGDRPAIMVGDRTYLDYAGLGRAAAGLARALRDRFGLQPGDRVLLAMTNNADYLTILFACWQSGLTAVPLNAKLHPREMSFIGQDADAKVVFATEDLAEALGGVFPALPIVIPGTAAFARLTSHDPVGMHDAGHSDPAWIFYTSGTTGQPKGAVLTHRNLMAMTVAYLADVDHLTPRDSLLHLAATSHASGLFGLSFVAKAGANILPESGGYDAVELAAILAKSKSLTFFAPSVLLNRMVADPTIRDARLENLRTVLTGAGPIYREDLKRWLGAFGGKIWNGYGQGESPCTITAMPKDVLWDAHLRGDDARLSSVGIARIGTDVRIDASPGEVGEVLVRGDTVMSGYLNRSEATALAIRDGWLHTGDLGRFDDHGFLTLLDRTKDVIITGGMNVYAREVEEALLTHPDVEEVAVIGLRDADWVEAVVALVVLRPGRIVDEAALDSVCLDRLARFKRPKRYLFVQSLPKNAAGKVLKAQLRTELDRQFAEATAPAEGVRLNCSTIL